MIKKALLDCSSGKSITLSLDGVLLKGVLSVNNITNINSIDTTKEINVTIIAEEVLVKKIDGEVVDISEV